jgi:parvulin-like peptidyl-prolyl isomerase
VLQHMTIVTEDRTVLEPLVKSALENEKKMISLGLERTRQRLAEFEQKHGMSSEEFEQRLNTFEIAETVEFSDWRIEIGMLRLLERQHKALENARLD